MFAAAAEPKHDGEGERSEDEDDEATNNDEIHFEPIVSLPEVMPPPLPSPPLLCVASEIFS